MADVSNENDNEVSRSDVNFFVKTIVLDDIKEEQDVKEVKEGGEEEDLVGEDTKKAYRKLICPLLVASLLSSMAAIGQAASILEQTSGLDGLEWTSTHDTALGLIIT